MRKRKSDHELAEEIANRLTNTPSGGRGPAADAQILLQHAANAGGGGLRQRYLAEAQREIAKLDPSRHRGTIQRLQSQALALQGRGGDTRIAHVTPGEIVIPRHLQTPEFIAGFVRLAHAHGINPRRFVVGSGHNSINPTTGQAEFVDDGNEYGENPLSNDNWPRQEACTTAGYECLSSDVSPEERQMCGVAERACNQSAAEAQNAPENFLMTERFPHGRTVVIPGGGAPPYLGPFVPSRRR
jgi:hypothetical protein